MTVIISGVSLVLNFGSIFALLYLLYAGFEFFTLKSAEFGLASQIGLIASLVFVAILFLFAVKNLWQKVNKL